MPVSKRKPRFKKQRRNKRGHLSGFESKVEDVFKAKDIPFLYEPIKLNYVLPSSKKSYKPDFVLGDLYIEVKGYMPYKDQLKMICVKESNPTLDIRFVFMKPHQQLPMRKTCTYAQWAELHKFPWTDLAGLVEDTWYGI